MKVWLGIAALALALRLTGIGYGLPAVFNADEPHLVNVAVSLGGGSLNPRFFKYPSLWIYALFTAYGAYFLAWSGFGLTRSAQQFGEFFVWNPEGFYLIGRLLAALASVLALERVYRAGRALWGERAGWVASALLAVSPVVVVAAHAAKPDCLLLFLASCSWAFAAQYFVSGRDRALLLCGLSTGLAASAQYTAIPLAVLPVSAWAARRLAERVRWKTLAGSLGAVAGGFFLGSPYVLLDYETFRRFVQDQRALEQAAGAKAGWAMVSGNLLTFAGPWWTAGLFLAGGAALLCLMDRPKALLLLLPPALYAACLAGSAEGGWQRYLFAVFPALALSAAHAVETAARSLSRLRPGWAGRFLPALTLLALAPGAWSSAAYDRELMLPDTRWLAARWIETYVPQGAKILMDQEHASPPLRQSLPMVERLLERTERTRHPRRKYYALMRSGHPGGGYAVYQLWRDPADLHTWPGHAAFSSAGRAVLDVGGGLRAAREEGIDWVVTSSAGARPDRSPRLEVFFMELGREGKFLAEFKPEAGRAAGPEIRVYRIAPW